MTRLLKSSLLAIAAAALFTAEASAQYYNPNPHGQNYGSQSIAGLSLGARNGGLNPNAGFGYGPVGAGAGLGLGRNGIGAGANTGIGPLGIAADGGLGRNGLGLRGAAGVGNTGAAFDGGVSGGGVGVGANARILGFGPGASIGVGERGPGLGASFAFGPLGTLLIGSHRNSYPGAEQTKSHMYPGQDGSYYTQQSYGRAPYYQPAPVQRPQYRADPPAQYSASRCPQNWVC